MMKSYDQIIKEVTTSFLKTIKNDISDEDIVRELFTKTIQMIEVENTNMPKKSQFKYPKELLPVQIGDILLHKYKFALIDFVGNQTDESKFRLAVYMDQDRLDFDNKGLYTISQEYIYGLAKRFNYNLTSSSFKEVMNHLRDNAPKKRPTIDQDLIPVNNGIFDFKEKKLLPFDPKYIFTTKTRTNYNENVKNIIIKENNDIWDVESWFSELSDDIEIVNSLWQITAACVRPHVTWNKMALLYSEQGNNGKGSLCRLIRNLCGKHSVTSMSMVEFEEHFGLDKLINVNAVITDENPVGAFVSRPDKLKAVVTGDEITINIKHEKSIAYSFKGFMIQCINDLPQIKDKTNSWYRRQLFIPMNKSFEGIEKTYIKEDYLARPEVLEYILHKVLHMDFYTLNTPSASVDLMDEYKRYNDPIRDFFFDVKDEFTWDKIPLEFMYDLYKAWFERKSPSGKLTNYRSFTKSIKEFIRGTTNWEYKKDRLNTSNAKPEPLIGEYDLKNWYSKTYNGIDINKKMIPTFKATHYTCIVKK